MAWVLRSAGDNNTYTSWCAHFFCIHHLDMSWYLHLQFPAFCWYFFMFCSLFMQLSCESHLWYAVSLLNQLPTRQVTQSPPVHGPNNVEIPYSTSTVVSFRLCWILGGIHEGISLQLGDYYTTPFLAKFGIDQYIHILCLNTKMITDWYGVSFRLEGFAKSKRRYIYRMIWTHYSFPNDSPGSSAIATMSFPGRSRAFPVFRGRHALS
jgi:hypothetical protein